MVRGVLQTRLERPVRRVRSQVLAPRKIAYLADARGLYRVFNPAVYRFYRSQTTPPVEGDTPFATNATLPDAPADLFGNGVWYLSVSRYNGIYDSGFLPLGPLGETYLRLDLTAGVETTSPPAGPLEWHIENVGGGVVRIIAVYAEAGTLRADEWSIGYTFNGVDPVVDTPDATETLVTDGLSVLSYDLAAQADGTTVKVRLQTRRLDASQVYSEDAEVKTATADAAGPSAVQEFTEGGSLWVS